MVQNLVMLPKKAEFSIDGWTIEIRNHKVKGTMGLFGKIMAIILDSESNRESLAEFEKHKISYEAVIEYCAHELECNIPVLAQFIKRYVEEEFMHPVTVKNILPKTFVFSKSAAGRVIADQFVEKIRSCDNWEQLYDEMQQTSKFCKDIQKRIIKEVKEQNKGGDNKCHRV